MKELLAVFVTLFKVVKMERENRRMNEKVDLFFQVEESDRIEPTGLYIRRKDLIRSEVLGTLRMVLKDQGTFKISHMREPAFLEALYDVQSGRAGKLVITVTEGEFDQFNQPVDQAA